MILLKLKSLAKEMPTQLKLISYYNILNYLATFVISIYMISLIVLGYLRNEQSNPLLLITILIPMIIVFVNYIVLVLNVKLLEGSKKAFWIMFILYLIVCIKINIGHFSYDINFTAIPLNFTIDLENSHYLRFNIIALFTIIYLFSIRNKYEHILLQANIIERIKKTKSDEFSNSSK